MRAHEVGIAAQLQRENLVRRHLLEMNWVALVGAAGNGDSSIGINTGEYALPPCTLQQGESSNPNPLYTNPNTRWTHALCQSSHPASTPVITSTRPTLPAYGPTLEEKPGCQ